jgi:long-chain acyl-CoA synthetase
MQKEPWSVDNGLLTPTLKLKRPILMKRLAPQIEAVYADASGAN